MRMTTVEALRWFEELAATELPRSTTSYEVTEYGAPDG
jgi:hypothetical protein